MGHWEGMPQEITGTCDEITSTCDESLSLAKTEEKRVVQKVVCCC